MTGTRTFHHALLHVGRCEGRLEQKVVDVVVHLRVGVHPHEAAVLRHVEYAELVERHACSVMYDVRHYVNHI